MVGRGVGGARGIRCVGTKQTQDRAVSNDGDGGEGPPPSPLSGNPGHGGPPRRNPEGTGALF